MTLSDMRMRMAGLFNLTFLDIGAIIKTELEIFSNLYIIDLLFKRFYYFIILIFGYVTELAYLPEMPWWRNWYTR